MYTINGSYKKRSKVIETYEGESDSTLEIPKNELQTIIEHISELSSDSTLEVPKTEMQTIIDNIYHKLNQLEISHNNNINNLVASVNNIQNNYVKYDENINIQNGSPTQGYQLLKRLTNNTAFIGTEADSGLSESKFKIVKPYP